MEPMMVEAVLGPRYETADSALLHRVSTEVCALIDRTTGVQTLMQMKTLIDLIRQSGFVPENQILDEHGYKQIYNEQLLLLVRKRVGKLQSGELSPSTSRSKTPLSFSKSFIPAVSSSISPAAPITPTFSSKPNSWATRISFKAASSVPWAN